MDRSEADNQGSSASLHHALRLVTLGQAALVSLDESGTRSTLLRPGKPLALLIYLALSPQRTASREHLVNLFWADVEPERGFRTLRQTIFQLRQLLGEDAIATLGRELCLTLDLSSDRDEFLAAITAGDYKTATKLYTGPFLPDFGVPGGAEFEHWADRERERLQSAYTRAADSLIRTKLDHAQYDAAVAEARRLRDFDPAREASWRLLLEALTSSGDYISALGITDELERFLSSEEREPESLTRSAIARAKRLQSSAASEESTSIRLVADLTGRDREFSRLTSAWTTVKAGHFRHVHVTAPPGIGKTRLLRDVFTRLRASGARAIWVNAIAGDRKLAYSLASDLVAKAGNLSGASGVSTAAAASLVALNPKLSSSFSAIPDRSVGDEALRHRVHAVTELFEALADETPIVVFIDDMHWSDPVSRQLLRSSFSRISNCRILLITSARAVPDGNLNLPVTDVVALEPLDLHQAQQLVSCFGAFADRAAGAAFVDALHQHTGGSPLLILESLHLAMDRGLLSLRDGEWTIPNVEALLESVSRGDVLEERLRKLSSRAFEILLLLAVAEEPLTVDTITLALSRDRSAMESDLTTLEQQALVAPDGTLWKCAHDSIAETVLRMVSAADRLDMHATLGTALSQESQGDLRRMRLAMRHLEAAGKRKRSEQVFARAVAHLRSSGDKRSNQQLALEMLGETSPTESSTRLVASLPVTHRLRLRSPARIAALSAVVIAAIAIAYRLQPAKPAQLAIVVRPLAASSLVVPHPVIEIDDANGRRVRDAHDTVSVEVVDPVPGIAGTLKVAAVDGRAEFKDVNVTGEGPFRLRFKARGLRDVITPPINVTTRYPTLRLVSGTVNGQSLNAHQRSIIVKPGDTISGSVMLEYSSYWTSASVILGATATWGDRTRNFVDLAPLFTPAESQPRRASFRFAAPETAGIYHIVFAFDAEGNVEDFLSGTNWRLPAPIWNDGNDVVDWTPAQLDHANNLGWVMSRFVKIDDSTGKPVTLPHPVAATVIDVIVR
jgi:DNA-binding SARP family transcriptional activator